MLIYTDGACKGNPGVLGYALIILYKGEEPATKELDATKVTVILGGEKYSTNNRMELTAVIKALEYADKLNYKSIIYIFTDSEYIVRAVNEGWIEKWIDKCFYKVKNQDLWMLIWKFLCKLKVKVTWVKGHDQNRFNEFADRTASELCFFQGEPWSHSIKSID